MQPAVFLELFSCGSGCMLRGTRRFDMVALADELKLKLVFSHPANCGDGTRQVALLVDDKQSIELDSTAAAGHLASSYLFIGIIMSE